MESQGSEPDGVSGGQNWMKSRAVRTGWSLMESGSDGVSGGQNWMESQGVRTGWSVNGSDATKTKEQ